MLSWILAKAHSHEWLCHKTEMLSGSVVAGGQADGEAEGEEDSGGAGEEDGVVAGVADDDAGDGACEEEGEIDEGVVGAEGSPAIFDGDGADGFDGERRKDE